MEASPPPDKYNLIFLTFVLYGTGALMPWNMFITAKDYFVDFKLGSSDAIYATNFIAYISFTSRIPNVVFNWLNVFVNLRGDFTKRIVWSILTEIVVFIVTVVIAMCDSSSWTGAFFWITMLSVVIINMANGVYQNTIYGMAGPLPIKYTGAVVLGSNISGVLTTIISIGSSFVFNSQRTAAIYYFITAIFILLVCFDTYFALPLNRFYRYHSLMREKEKNKTDIEASSRPPIWTIFKEAAPQLFNVFFIFFVTLTLFPAVHSDIRQSDKNFVVPSSHFTIVTCFLTYNLFTVFGSLLTSWVKWPKPNYLVIPVTLRVVFIPLFVFCNYIPRNVDRTLPVLIENDWVYWIIAVIMSFTSGYLGSLAMMYTPKSVTPKYQATAGMISAAMLMTGIFSGLTFTMVFPFIVGNRN